MKSLKKNTQISHFMHDCIQHIMSCSACVDVLNAFFSWSDASSDIVVFMECLV